jgi:FkbM family methyltransferase
VLINETYEPILSTLPARPLRVLDIGGHIGSFMIWLSEKKTVGEANCLEPDPDSFNLCRFNLAKQPIIQVIMAGIGGHTRRSLILIDHAARARSTIMEGMGRGGNATSVDVLVVSLAEWLADYPGPFDFLKMDCEGAEWEILRMCPETFSSFSLVVVEMHYDPVDHRFGTDFARALQRLGFQIIPNDRLVLGTRIGLGL